MNFVAEVIVSIAKIAGFFGFVVLVIFAFLLSNGAVFYITTSKEMKKELKPVWDANYSRINKDISICIERHPESVTSKVLP